MLQQLKWFLLEIHLFQLILDHHNRPIIILKMEIILLEILAIVVVEYLVKLKRLLVNYGVRLNLYLVKVKVILMNLTHIIFIKETLINPLIFLVTLNINLLLILVVVLLLQHLFLECMAKKEI